MNKEMEPGQCSLPNTKIGFLGGGKMAQSLCKGFISTGLVGVSDIIASVSDISKPVPRPVQDLGVTVTDDNQAVVLRSNVLILCVKPHIVPTVLKAVSEDVLSSHLVISVAAGVTLDSMSQMLPLGTRIIRSMPNTPALVQCGATVFTPGPNATKDDIEICKKLFGSVGICEQVQEHQIDIATGLSGGGPAYVFTAIEALSDGGVKMGLHRNIATKLAAQTLMGAGKMVLETGSHPGQLKDDVTSPGGTTAAGLHELEKAAFRAALMNAVEAATNRSRELGKK